ncbi:hypothetical protein GCM10011510_11350 [Streptococcus himalayensis]|uniref:Uncharacterized protein n=1 Tax=Streptococcus himalayensis TaxID=1888195 RepID=A0A917A8X6_9STRE|nr:hypothetical protein GCM10011510_11350 [Streptococcus himalayensis]
MARPLFAFVDRKAGAYFIDKRRLQVSDKNQKKCEVCARDKREALNEIGSGKGLKTIERIWF